jgi:hypothetical protein
MLWFYFGYSSYFTLRDDNGWAYEKADAPSHAKQNSRMMQDKRGVPMRESKVLKSALEGESRASVQQGSALGWKAYRDVPFWGWVPLVLPARHWPPWLSTLRRDQTLKTQNRITL